MSNKIKARNYVLITIFAVVFSYVVQDGLRLVIQKFLGIPIDYMTLAYWGDTFFLRIFASLFATATGTFVIGTFLKKRAKLTAVIATLPTILFWIAIFILGVVSISKNGYTFKSVKIMLLLPAILAILSPVIGWISAGWGQELIDEFKRSKCVLNIKWYHWLWIFPFYLSKVVAVSLFTLVLLWKIDLLHDSNSLYPGLFDFIANWSYFLLRVIIFAILYGLVSAAFHTYLLLSEEKVEAKVNWVNGLIIFGYVLLFSVLYAFLFANIW